MVEPGFGTQGERCGSKGLKTCAEQLYCGGQKQGCMDCPGTCMARDDPSVTVDRPVPTSEPTSIPQESLGIAGDWCGSKGLKNCMKGLVCGQQKEGCMGCGGVCEKQTVGEKACGGFMGIGCEGGLQCVVDDICVKEGGSDCQGKCITI